MTELWNLVVLLVEAAWNLLHFLGGTALHWLLPIAWIAWWLFGVNWNKAWPVLRSGAWVALVLAVLTAAMVWAQLAPGEYTLFETVSIPNFWWQLAAVTLITAATLFCGWLQGVMGWAPTEIDLDPADHAEPAAGHGHH